MTFITNPKDSDSSEDGRADTFEGHYESLKRYTCPEWFRDAKFGIWSHWGPQCVPQSSGWYGRQMYLQDVLDFSGTVYAHQFHQEHYGHQSEFGFKDLIPLFTAEKWDPDKLMKLYKRAGAKYFVAMGQHHDNFDMWDSKLQPWNAVNMGPRRDTVREWKDAADREGLYFGISFHGEPAWRYFESSRLSDISGPKKGVPYDGWLTKEDGKGKWWEGYDPRDLYCRPHKPTEPAREMWAGDIKGTEITDHGEPPDDAYMDQFVARVLDAVDAYQPELIYFDTPSIPAGEERGLDMIADFYNRSMGWHAGENRGVVQGKKLTAQEQEMFMLNIEIGHSGEILEEPWQTDIGLDGWFYFKRDKPRYLSTTDVIHTLIDIVSKNGNMLLNITQTADGEIQPYAYVFLAEMGDWMEVNAEAIHGTRPWKIFGEGPTRDKGDKGQKRHATLSYTEHDFRFTLNNDCLYAILMKYPEDGGWVRIKSLDTFNEAGFNNIQQVSLLGHTQELEWVQAEDGLEVNLPIRPPCKHAVVIKVM